MDSKSTHGSIKTLPAMEPIDGMIYIAIKGSVHANDCSVFGLQQEEIRAINQKFPGSGPTVVNDENCTHTSCSCMAATTSVCQTISEMDWERGIWFAASSGDDKRVETLISKSKSPCEIVRAVDNSGYTALHYAARNGHLKICQVLVKNGADIDAVTKSGKATALQRAATAGKIDVVVYLIKVGANPQLQDADGKTALQRAIESGHIPIVQRLLQACPELLEMKDDKGHIMKDIISELEIKL